MAQLPSFFIEGHYLPYILYVHLTEYLHKGEDYVLHNFIFYLIYLISIHFLSDERVVSSHEEGVRACAGW